MIPIPNGYTLQRVITTTGVSSIVNGPNGPVYGVAAQSNGSLIVVGAFNGWNGSEYSSSMPPVAQALRLKQNNTTQAVELDTTFDVGTASIGFGGWPTTVTVQSDDKVLIGGNFALWGDWGYFVRLNPNGDLDGDFMTSIGSGSNNVVRQIAVQSDGKIIVVGEFTAWNGQFANRIQRLNSNGTRDTSSFYSNLGTMANNNIYGVVIQSDGKIVLYGLFDNWNGTAISGNMVRLNADGTRDTSFNTAIGTGPNNPPVCVVRDSSDNLVVGGSFNAWNSVSVNGIVKLTSTGSRDGTFTAASGFNSGLYDNASIKVQSDGKVVIGRSLSVDRLNSDGTADTTFNTNTVNGSSDVYGVYIEASGKLVVHGNFVQWGSASTSGGKYVARINSDGTTDPNFNSLNSMPGLVFAIVVGGGGGGAVASGAGGGGGAIVWGLVPKSNLVAVGAGAVFGSSAPVHGDPSSYSTLFAQGGWGGGATFTGFGAGSSSGAGVAAAGSSLMYAVGGGGGASVTNSTAATAAIGSAGGPGTSGGSGGGATQTVVSAVATGAIGGSGFVGGGGGAARVTISSSSTATAGAGGAGVYAGGTGATRVGTSLKYCGGGGGGGYLGPGENGTSAITNALGNSAGGNGGLGGGGGGGSSSNTFQNEGDGGVGCVLLYW
jgi:uncharacterized delta-60 repeat protein